MKWSVSSYEELSKDELYEILKMRAHVFVVRQKSCYQDLDDKDKHAWHVMGYQDDRLLAYCRVIREDGYVSIGRVLVDEEVRGRGVGHELLRTTLTEIESLGIVDVRLSSQTYVVDFYKKHGFEVVGEEYWDVGVLHIDMVKKESE